MRIKLRTHVLGLVGSALLFAGIIAAAGLAVSSALEGSIRSYGEERVPSLEAVNGLALAVAAVTGNASVVEAGGDAAVRARSLAAILGSLADARLAAERFEALPQPERVAETWKETRLGLELWIGNVAAFDAAAREQGRMAEGSGEAAAAQATLTDRFERLRTDTPALLVRLETTAHATRAAADDMRAEAAGTVRDARWALVVVFAAAAAMLGVAGLMFARFTARTLATLNREARRLRDAVAAGDLAVRAEAGAVSWEFRPIVEGMNETMDAFARPMRLAADNLARIGMGDVPPPIAEHYAGDFEVIVRSLNGCIGAVNALVDDAQLLAQAGVEGRLDVRADAARHEGHFRRIVEGVNATLDTVVGPINESTAVLERLAKKDLRARMTGRYPGDHARTKEAINATAAALGDALSQVAVAVGQVSEAAGQIAASSQSVAAGATQQASALTQTGSSIASVATVTRSAAGSAQAAKGITSAALAAATDGAAAVNELETVMGGIRRSAEGTSQIIKDVSEIAFQTNLLALNAAVEAARAGEAGRGFAVVAEEVRSLALRAKEAAKRTEELIRQSVSQAASGATAAKEVAGKLGEIRQGVTKVTEIVSAIAAAATEQDVAIGQVNAAIAEMDRVTQHNAASAEQSSRTASALNAQADELAVLVGGFELTEGAAPALARA